MAKLGGGEQGLATSNFFVALTFSVKYPCSPPSQFRHAPDGDCAGTRVLPSIPTLPLLWAGRYPLPASGAVGLRGQSRILA